MGKDFYSKIFDKAEKAGEKFVGRDHVQRLYAAFSTPFTTQGVGRKQGAIKFTLHVGIRLMSRNEKYADC